MNPSPPQKAKAQLTPDFQKSGFPSQLISKLITISGGTIKSAACRLWRRSSRIGLVRSGKVSPLRLRSQTIQLHTQRESDKFAHHPIYRREDRRLCAVAGGTISRHQHRDTAAILEI